MDKTPSTSDDSNNLDTEEVIARRADLVLLDEAGAKEYVFGGKGLDNDKLLFDQGLARTLASEGQPHGPQRGRGAAHAIDIKHGRPEPMRTDIVDKRLSDDIDLASSVDKTLALYHLTLGGVLDFDEDFPLGGLEARRVSSCRVQ